jgi:hypothetical protein
VATIHKKKLLVIKVMIRTIFDGSQKLSEPARTAGKINKVVGKKGTRAILGRCCAC